MSNNLKVLLLTVSLSLPAWWGVNLGQSNLEQVFSAEITKDINFNAQVSQSILDHLRPFRIQTKEELDLEVKSGIAVLVKPEGDKKILFSKNCDEKLPIASLTKLMTATIALENYGPDQKITITEEAVKQIGDNGQFKVGEIFSVKDLLYSLLMESSNDAADALAKSTDELAFVGLMNSKSQELGLENTFFADPSGLGLNYSCPRDLTKLAYYILNNHPLIFEISGLPEFELLRADCTLHHTIFNTNELVGVIPGVIGGKTGWTPQANGCLILLSEAPENQGYLINVILGSDYRFVEMEKLIHWVYDAYNW